MKQTFFCRIIGIIGSEKATVSEANRIHEISLQKSRLELFIQKLNMVEHR